MCLDSEIHTCTEVKFIQELRVGGLLHSNHLILTNEDSTAELWNIKIDYAEKCFHARHITLFYKISCSCKGWNCPWFKSRLCLMKRFWVDNSGPSPCRAVTNPGKYKICSPTNLIWYPTKEHGMSVVCTVHILAQRYLQYIYNLHIFFAAARK